MGPVCRTWAFGLLGLVVAGSARAQDCVCWSFRDVEGPSPRQLHAMAYDSARAVTVLFGGDDIHPFGYLRDTWEWNGSTWTQRGGGGGDGPVGNMGHSMAYDSVRGVTVLHGGNTGGGVTWEWDGGAWTLRSMDGPGWIAYAAMAYDSARGVTVLFGGYWGGDTYGDTWVWNGNTWSLRATTGPSPRAFHAMAYDSARGVTVLYGGSSGGGETWEWDGSAWTLRSGGEPAPNHRSLAMVYDTERAVVVRVSSGDTWEWDGDTWTRRATDNPPSREGFAMAYDMARGVSVLFGGGQYLDDTWELDTLVIVQPPESLTVPFGGQAVFTVQTEGAEPITYQWRKDEVPLVDDERVSGANTQTLTIDPVEWADAGVYDVVVTNDCCLVTSDPVTLTVESPCVGDITGDGDTDQTDLGILLAVWGTCDGDWDYDPAADLNGDGCVNQPDLGILLADWGCGTGG